jgi:hypothetical protein
MNREVRQMILGGSMLVVGWLVLLGIVVEVIPSHVVLSLAAYCLTLVGFMVGVIGAIAKIRADRSKDNY